MTFIQGSIQCKARLWIHHLHIQFQEGFHNESILFSFQGMCRCQSTQRRTPCRAHASDPYQLYLMEEVEKVHTYQPVNLLFEGEPNLDDVKLNREQSKNIYKLILNAKTKEAMSNVTKTIFEIFPQLLALSVSEQTAKSVCAKIVSKGQTIVECLNCRVDESCIICLNCFKNGNHEGHKVLYKKAYGGCCDCGDAEAWNPQGFCKQHSGQSQDIKIQPSDLNKFTRIMEDLVYLYFRVKLKKQNHNVERVVLITLLNVFDAIVEKGPKGIKLCALFLKSRIPDHLKYNEQLQKRSIITHLFTWNLIGNHLKFWQPLFIKMFPYYQFKKVLVATYIQYFPQLYASEQACMIGQSLACQILTSYKLVQDYVDSPHSQPIGYNFKGITDQQHMNYASSMLCTDLQKIIKLQDPVPEKYIRLMISKGIGQMFSFHQLLTNQMKLQKHIVEQTNKKQQSKEKKKKKKKKAVQEQEEAKQVFFNAIFFMMRNIRSIFNQYTTLQMLSALLKVISKDRLSLMKMLKQLATLIDNSYEQLIIFRPYDRAFALTLFTLCNQNLERLLQFQFRRDIMELLDKNEQTFEIWLKKLEQRMLTTYFFYPHILCNQNRGYHTSFFNYIYLYRSKDNFLISIDTIQIKMMALLCRTSSTLDFTQLMRFKDFDQQKWTTFILNSFYREFQLLYVGDFSQIYIAHYQITTKDNKVLIRDDVIQYLAKFLVSQGNCATLDRVNQFSRAFLFDNTEFLKKCLLQCCTYLKDKKIFELKHQFRQQKPINFKDFELRLKDDEITNKNDQQSRPQLTNQLIKGYNTSVFSHFWNDQNIQKIKQIFLDLYEEACQLQVHDNIVEIASIICKFCYTLRALASPDQQTFVDQILLRTKFSPAVKLKLSLYKDLIGQEQVQADSKLKEKKQLLLQKKMKKMQQIKKKQIQNMTSFHQVHKMEVQSQQIQQQYCAICRNKESQKYQLVYLVNIDVRNLQKMANLGPGTQTISLSTCYHIFDYACLEKECKFAYEANLKCPICRRSGNIFFPVYPLFNQQKSHPYVTACIERVTQVMMTIHSYRQIDPAQQLFKSFYHIVLLSSFDVEYVKKSRMKLYQIIIDMFCHFKVQHDLPQLLHKFINNQITLNPKYLKKDKVSIINLKQGQQDFLEDQSDSEFQEQSESLFIYEMPQKHSAVTKKTAPKGKGQKTQASASFKYMGIRILKHIIQKIKQMNQAPQQTSEQVKFQKPILSLEQLDVQILPEVPLQIQFAVDQLLGVSTLQNEQSLKPRELQFIKLPEIFHWDMNKNECDLCKQPCHDLFICLLCGWKGCVNCKSGGVNKHVCANHGETSAFMRVNEGVIYMIGTKMIKKIGCAYLNEWGEPLRLKYDWNNYTLQQDVLNKTKNRLLRDE